MNSEWAETPQQQPQGNLALAGAQLKAQREALGWPVEQVADQLKLAPRQVIALEEGDMAALPNVAVVRGFVRAYAKVVRLDAAPLVAMIEVHPAPTQDPAAPVRREISATFSESRFPSMTQRSSNQATVWIVGAVVVVVAAAFGAYKLGYVPAGLLSAHAEKETAHAEVGPVETTLIKPGQDLTPVQSPSVPLISVPPPPGNDTQTGAPAAAVASAPAAALPPAAARGCGSGNGWRHAARGRRCRGRECAGAEGGAGFLGGNPPPWQHAADFADGQGGQHGNVRYHGTGHPGGG